YVSNSQFTGMDEYLCTGTNHQIPVVTNCSVLTASADTIVEDWYGFPVGDLNASCTSCTFAPAPKVYNRSAGDPTGILLSRRIDHSVDLMFEHDAPVSVWSLVLKPDFPVRQVEHVKLSSFPGKGLKYSLDESENTIRLLFSETLGNGVSAFQIRLEWNRMIPSKLSEWSISNDDARLHNVLIDRRDSFHYLNQLTIRDDWMVGKYVTLALDEIQLEDLDLNNGWVRVYNINGDLVTRSKLETPQLRVSSLVPGVYFLRYHANGTENHLKFIKL
ncbi:MAG TPA: T9SS type A sorting domain-containing protein, partial [Saprospiraceae bacterium]|nr:T9SS type A sorting domain-containing protein [Saprospiraceae bacterium]